MTAEDIAALRQHFGDILAPAAGIEVSIPDIWVPAIRFALSKLRRIRDGELYPDTPALDMHVRAVKVVRRRFSASARPSIGFEIFAPAARGRTQEAILSALVEAQHSCDAADKQELARQCADDLAKDAARYVRECITNRRVVEYRHVAFSSVYDTDWEQAAYRDLVVQQVRAFTKGGIIDGLNDGDRSRFFDVYKSEG